jgi:hypothetical protein
MALVAAPSAGAHGPCHCTSPEVVRPGSKTRTGTAYKIIFNPAPSDFRNQTTPDELASGYRADAPRAVVLDLPRSQPMRRATFRVPKRTPPGIYFVLIFDGSEGGAHTTWDYLQVPGEPAQGATTGAPPESAAAPEASSAPVLVALALGALAAIILVVAGVRARAGAARLAKRRSPDAL